MGKKDIYHGNEKIQILYQVLYSELNNRRIKSKSPDSTAEQENAALDKIQDDLAVFADILDNIYTKHPSICNYDTPKETRMMRADSLITSGLIGVILQGGDVRDFLDGLKNLDISKKLSGYEGPEGFAKKQLSVIDDYVTAYTSGKKEEISNSQCSMDFVETAARCIFANILFDSGSFPNMNEALAFSKSCGYVPKDNGGRLSVGNLIFYLISLDTKEGKSEFSNAISALNSKVDRKNLETLVSNGKLDVELDNTDGKAEKRVPFGWYLTKLGN